MTSLTSNGNDGSNNNKRTGGIAWSGSLVGSENPNNLGYRYSNPLKRYRREGDDDDDENGNGNKLPTNVVIKFQNRQGEELANHLDIPTNATVDDLQALVHSLLEQQKEDNDDDDDFKRIPYTFYAQVEDEKNVGIMNDVEVTTSLVDLIRQYSLSTEQTIQLTYQPLSIFKVRPVTRCTDTMPGHTEAILHVSFSPNGKQLASGGGDTTVRFWDVNTSLPKFTCQQHKNHVLCTAWSPDGTRFASSDKNGTLIVWDPTVSSSSSSKKMKNNNKDSDNKDKKNNDMKNGLVKFIKSKAHKQWITYIAWEPMHLNNGKCERLVTSSKDMTCKIWNVRTQASLVTLCGHTDSIECVKWGGEGFIYTASRDRTIKVWTTKDYDGDDLGKLVRTLKGHSHRVNTLALSSDYICRTGPFDHKGKTMTTTTSTSTSMETDDGDDNDDDDKRTKQLRREAYQAAADKYMKFKQEQGPERLVSGSDDYTLFVWHPTDQKHPVKRLTGHQQAVNHIAFSPDGRYFASASFDKKVKIWNGISGDFLTTLTGHVGAVYQVSWSPDSRYLVSASKDSTAKLWQIPSGKKAKATLPGHADEVYALDWSPNGTSVATGSKDRTIKIWKH